MDTQEPNISFTIFLNWVNIQPLALKPFMHKNFFRNRMDLNDAVDANLILAAKKDHHEYQQSAEN